MNATINFLDYAADANFNMLRVWGGGVYEVRRLLQPLRRVGHHGLAGFHVRLRRLPRGRMVPKRSRTGSDGSRSAAAGASLNCCVVRQQRKPVATQRALASTRQSRALVRLTNLRVATIAGFARFLTHPTISTEFTVWRRGLQSGRHEGDRHNWEVWSQGIDYPAYLKDNGRFISEFGWQAPPTMELLSGLLGRSRI